MTSYETSATVEDDGRLLLDGVPFAAGTQVEVVISPKSVRAPQSIEAARVRMRELFASVKGFRIASKIPREDL